MADNPFDEFLRRYRTNPVLFAEEVIGVTPDPWQAECLNAVGRGERHIAVRSGHGVGKALSNRTMLHTPEGLRRWGDLLPNDLVFAEDGSPSRIVGLSPQGMRPMFKVTFDDGSSVEADADHIWKVRGRQERRKGSSEWRTLTTAQLLEAGVRRSNGVGKARQWEIPIQGAAQFPSRDVPVHPYTIGAWLGDGARCSSVLTSQDEDVTNHLRECGETVTVKLSDSDAWTIWGLAKKLIPLGIGDLYSYQKHVPVIYLENSADVRTEVLRGLLDTDGECGTQGTVTFSSCSRALALDVIWLARSLGGKARMQPTIKKPQYNGPNGEKLNGRDCWRATITMPRGFQCFYVKRKEARLGPVQSRYLCRWIDKIEPIGDLEAQCISIDHPSRCFLANDFIVTHNTTWVSWAAIWFIFTRYPVKIVATSQSAPQLFDAFFSELKRWIKELRPELQSLLDVKSDRIELMASPTEAFISARTSRAESPEALAGVHSDNVMLIGDEASGIPEQVYQAAGGSMSGHTAVTILTGNPIRSSGYFYDVFHKMKDRWWTKRVSCLDSPRVSREYIEDIAAQYGIDSNVYRVRVLGEFPRADDDTVIPMELIEAAVNRDMQPLPTAPVVWGLDVARFGNDSTCLIKRQSNVITEPPRTWQGLDLMQTSMMVKAEYDATEPSRRPVEILVDSIGLGAGVVDRLRELNLPARGINVSELPAIGTTYLNLRSELWFKAKAWLEKRDCSIPNDERLRNELATVRYQFQAGSSKLKIESKDDMKRRGLRSPDVADAFVLCFASDAGVALFGTSYTSDWKKPIRRGLVNV